MNGFVTHRVFNTIGEEVRMLVNEFKSVGSHEVTFNSLSATGGRDLASGIYFYRIIAGRFTAIKKMILLK